MESCPLDDIVTYSNEAVNSIDWLTDSNMGIKAGEQITMEQSLYGLLVGSANEAGNAIGEHISGSIDSFVDLMNKKPKISGAGIPTLLLPTEFLMRTIIPRLTIWL